MLSILIKCSSLSRYYQQSWEISFADILAGVGNCCYMECLWENISIFIVLLRLIIVAYFKLSKANRRTVWFWKQIDRNQSIDFVLTVVNGRYMLRWQNYSLTLVCYLKVSILLILQSSLVLFFHVYILSDAFSRKNSISCCWCYICPHSLCHHCSQHRWLLRYLPIMVCLWHLNLAVQEKECTGE